MQVVEMSENVTELLQQAGPVMLSAIDSMGETFGRIVVDEEVVGPAASSVLKSVRGGKLCSGR